MKNRFSIFRTVVLGVLGPAFGSFAHAQPGPVTLDDAARREAVETTARILRDRYVFPDVGEQAAQALEAALAEGSYDELSNYQAFAARLTDDMRAIAHDKHLRVTALGAPPPPAESN